MGREGGAREGRGARGLGSAHIILYACTSARGHERDHVVGKSTVSGMWCGCSRLMPLQT